jgi:hypothetical protein
MIEYISDIDQNNMKIVEKDEFVDECINAKYVGKRTDEWNTQLSKKGPKYSSFCKMKVFRYKIGLNIILEFSLPIPGTNTATEVTHSIANAVWTSQNNHFLFETIKALIMKKAHFQHLSYNEF